MRFTVLGHGALSVEAAGARLLVDPWLIGSCYWRSWWHYPPTELRDEDLEPDFVFLSHHHFDHFHYPSMRKLRRDATVVVPRFGVDVLPKEVRGLGFDRVLEVDHGEVTELAPGLRIASFQYGVDDTVLLVESGGTVLADMNDCKVRGRALREVLDVFGRPTFLFKSHSWAQAYPVRYTSEDPKQLSLVSRESYVADFIELAEAVAPEHAVPFASMVCFLHPETFEVNQHIVTPVDVAAGFDRRPVSGTDVVVLSPGDSWSATEGFELGSTDWYDPEVRAAALDDLARRAAPAIQRRADDEAGRTIEWEAFHSHFQAFVDALPPLAARLALARPIVFHVASDADSPAWVVDARRRRVHRAAVPPPDAASVITVNEAVLADAVRDRVVNLVHISLRLRIDLRPGGVDSDLAFWGLLTLWEIGYLPVTKLPLRRAVSTGWRRRREIAETVTGRLLKRGSFAERMTEGMIVATPGE